MDLENTLEIFVQMYDLEVRLSRLVPSPHIAGRRHESNYKLTMVSGGKIKGLNIEQGILNVEVVFVIHSAFKIRYSVFDIF